MLLVALLAATVSASAVDTPDLTGTWAMIQFLPEVADIPFVGEVAITAVVGLLVEVEQDGTSITMRDTYCRTEVLSDGTIVTSEVPDLVMESLEPEARTAILERRGSRWKLRQDTHIEIRGAILEDPESDPLPLGAWDPRVIDLDGDGCPGFTVPIAAFALIAGDTYVVQRLMYEISCDNVDPEAFEGPIEWSSEQVVIGGTDAMLMTPFESWRNPDQDRHRYIMRRLPESATCADVIAILEAEKDAYLLAFPLNPQADS